MLERPAPTGQPPRNLAQNRRPEPPARIDELLFAGTRSANPAARVVEGRGAQCTHAVASPQYPSARIWADNAHPLAEGRWHSRCKLLDHSSSPKQCAAPRCQTRTHYKVDKPLDPIEDLLCGRHLILEHQHHGAGLQSQAKPRWLGTTFPRNNKTSRFLPVWYRRFWVPKLKTADAPARFQRRPAHHRQRASRSHCNAICVPAAENLWEGPRKMAKAVRKDRSWNLRLARTIPPPEQAYDA